MTRSPAVPHRHLFAGIFVVALSTLLIELSLMRILSFTIWHHFGYVVISTALLGFGAAGTFLAIRPSLGTHDLRETLTGCCWLSAVTSVGLVGFVSAMPLHPLSILKEPSQLALMVAYLVAAAVPFFFSGLLVSLSLREAAERVDRLYFWDLIGAGLGCIIAVGLMNWIAPPGAAVVAAAGFALAGAIYAGSRASRAGCVAGVAVLLVLASLSDRIPFTPAATKQLSMLTQLMGMEPVFMEWTALFRTDLVEDPRPESRQGHFGLSARAPSDVAQPRFYLAHDATAGAGIYDLSDGHEIGGIEYNVLHLPYLVANPDPKVLVIGVGGGLDLVVAAQYGASDITGAELDPVAVKLIRDELDHATAGFFRQPHIRLMATEGRHFIRAAEGAFDVIQLTGVDTLSAVNSGAYVLAENYLYTVEAFHDYLDHLEPGGILSFAMANQNPRQPRAAGRIVAVAQQALRERGIEHPEAHIAVVDSKALYAEVMIRSTPFEAHQVERLESVAADLDFRPLWLPGRKGNPVFRALASATGAERDELLAQQRFKLTPSTDDNPFFLSFFHWSGLFEPGKITPSHASALTQIVLGILLISLSTLAAVLILLPLAVFSGRPMGGAFRQRVGVMLYFAGLGLGFMLFEISLIQRFVLFLGYPTYSLSVTLCSLLIFLGWGSFLSRRWVGREDTILPLAVIAIAMLAAFYMNGLPAIQDQFLGSPIGVRVCITVAALAPLGLVMGIFFPLGVRLAASIHEDLVPWAWGVNGCASVTAGVLAVVLAMGYGFSTVWAMSVVVYAVGTFALLASTRSLRQQPTAE